MSIFGGNTECLCGYWLCRRTVRITVDCCVHGINSVALKSHIHYNILTLHINNTLLFNFDQLMSHTVLTILVTF